MTKFRSQGILPRDILAIFGVHRLSDLYEVGRFTLSPQKMFIHEDWNQEPTSYDADISLLKFEKGGIIMNSYINPICIWDSSEDPLENEGVLTGWGRNQEISTEHGGVPKMTKVEIEDNDECVQIITDLFELSSRRTFCAGSKKGSGVCIGDGGGGLFINVDGIYFLKGIISSFSRIDGNCDTSNYTVYTNIDKFTDWIKQITQETFTTIIKGNLVLF